ENVKVSAEYDAENDEVNAALDGENLGLLIGHHGDVLDALQYLAGLAANRGKKDFTRVTLDIENYRAKRIETLRSLARRSASKVKKTGRNVTFETMNAYERRIIHSEVQGIEGVTTYSIGNGDDRRVVISLEGAPKRAPKSEAKPKTSAKPQQNPAPKQTYIYNPERPPRQIVKAKSIEDINLADVEDTEIVTFE
ncbi:MAG: KH domain-containing protein, partial [Clostridia bacterium]|nr:KH domain-containing protein [Clostridia bacterium]